MKAASMAAGNPAVSAKVGRADETLIRVAATPWLEAELYAKTFTDSSLFHARQEIMSAVARDSRTATEAAR